MTYRQRCFLCLLYYCWLLWQILNIGFSLWLALLVVLFRLLFTLVSSALLSPVRVISPVFVALVSRSVVSRFSLFVVFFLLLLLRLLFFLLFVLLLLLFWLRLRSLVLRLFCHSLFAGSLSRLIRLLRLSSFILFLFVF